MFKTVRQPFFAPDGDGQGEPNQEGGVTFTPEQQAHMDKIIGQRITSVKASYAGYEDLKEIADNLKSFGYEGTVAEVKAELKAEAEQRKKATELKELEEEAETTGTSPELLAEIKALKKDLAEIKSEKEQQKQQEEANKKAAESWTEQVAEFTTAHPDIDMDKLPSNEKFMKHLKNSNPSLSFLEVYDGFIELVGSVESEAIDKIKANDSRSTFSGKAKADPTGGTHGLTERQQKLAKDGDMSFKEYADLMKQNQ